MGTFRVTSPAPGYAGLVGNVQFADGAAVIDEDANAAELAYVRAAGYGVEPLDVDQPIVEDVDGDGVVEQLPKKSASAEVWRAFAVAHGMAEDEANSKSRDELVARYYEGSAQ